MHKELPNSLQKPEPLIKRRKLAQALGVSSNTIANWMRRGMVPFIKPSPRLTLFRLSEVEHALRKRSQ